MTWLSADQSTRQGQFLPYTPEHFFNAKTFSSQTAFCDHVLDAIVTATSHQEIIYRDVLPVWAESVVVFLNEKAEHASARFDIAISFFLSFFLLTDSLG